MPHFSRVSRCGAFPEAGIAVEVLQMKICERVTFTSAKAKTAQGLGKAPCLETRETWGTLGLFAS